MDEQGIDAAVCAGAATDTASAADAAVELMLTDNQRTALEHAFADSRSCLMHDGAMVPFTILCTSDGFEVAGHPGEDPRDVYESVRTLLAREIPEAYVLAYDGYVDLATGREDAIVCETARRGEVAAALLAQPYERGEGAYAFAPTFYSVGQASHLYPSGTKPIVSGLVALEAERERASLDGLGLELHSDATPE